MSTPTSLRYPVLYLRGLNTAGDEQLRFGRLAVGPMHHHWKKELEARGARLIPLFGRGGGPLKEQIEKSIEIIRAMPEWKDAQEKFHLLSHSTGGLVARALVHKIGAPERFISVATVACPHRGSWLADRIPEVPRLRPKLNHFLRLMNYKIDTKLSAFQDLTQESVKEFNESYPDVSGVAYGSAVFGLPSEHLSWPVYWARRLVDGTSGPADDGIVRREDQIWGQVWFEGALDHMNQIGYDLRLKPFQRQATRREFLRLVEHALAFLAQNESYLDSKDKAVDK